MYMAYIAWEFVHVLHILIVDKHQLYKLEATYQFMQIFLNASQALRVGSSLTECFVSC